jgi:hypothetical protein
MKSAKLLGRNSGTIPYGWNSMAKVRYEWREHLGNSDSYKGIAQESTTFKMATKLLIQNESADAESIYLVR